VGAEETPGVHLRKAEVDFVNKRRRLYAAFLTLRGLHCGGREDAAEATVRRRRSLRAGFFVSFSTGTLPQRQGKEQVKGRMYMGHQLKKMRLPGGMEAEERACGDYVCRYCKGKATACNFVADMCLQVYARHNGLCGAYVESDQYVGYVTDCTTCTYEGLAGDCRFGDQGSAAHG